MKKRNKKKKKFLEGIVDHVNKRYSFIECEKLNKDVKVFNYNMKGAIHKDKVLFSLNDKVKNEGKIIKVLERDRNVFVGKLEDNKDFAFFIPDNKNIYTDFFIKKKIMRNMTETLKYLLKLQTGILLESMKLGLSKYLENLVKMRQK